MPANQQRTNQVDHRTYKTNYLRGCSLSLLFSPSACRSTASFLRYPDANGSLYWQSMQSRRQTSSDDSYSTRGSELAPASDGISLDGSWSGLSCMTDSMRGSTGYVGLAYAPDQYRTTSSRGSFVSESISLPPSYRSASTTGAQAYGVAPSAWPTAKAGNTYAHGHAAHSSLRQPPSDYSRHGAGPCSATPGTYPAHNPPVKSDARSDHSRQGCRPAHTAPSAGYGHSSQGWSAHSRPASSGSVANWDMDALPSHVRTSYPRQDTACPSPTARYATVAKEADLRSPAAPLANPQGVGPPYFVGSWVDCGECRKQNVKHLLNGSDAYAHYKENHPGIRPFD